MRIAISFFILMQALWGQVQKHNEAPWKGDAILGNGRICVVYTDDPRIIEKSKYPGIQHLYYNNYAVDYAASSSFTLLGNDGNPMLVDKSDSVGLSNFFTTKTIRHFESNISTDSYCFVSNEDVVVQKFIARNLKQKAGYHFNLVLRENFKSDVVTKMVVTKVENGKAIIQWSNGVYMIVTSTDPKHNITIADSIISLEGNIPHNNSVEVRIIMGSDLPTAKNILAAGKKKDLQKEAAQFWNAWLRKGTMPIQFSRLSLPSSLDDYYKRTLYAVKAATINGQIPADMTGQFVTNNMPQLYPRDAMKCARAFLKTGHYDEVKDIITFWTKPAIPKKSPGEFFARYDANAKAVDAGSGARYDEPEWDANGYIIQLLNWYHEQKNEWLAPKEFIYSMADFIVSKIDSTGLLYEGGIVEWTAYLPTTNMVCAAGLTTAAKLALLYGDTSKAIQYRDGAEKISQNLFKTFDLTDNSYKAIRFHGAKATDNRSITSPALEKLFMWDGTMQFGAIWGYPIDPMLSATIRFYENNIIALGGGMQYFQALEPGLSAYGNDCFFFTTASLAQYYARFEKPEKALLHLSWMCKNSNIYRLMPERIYLNQSDCSDASPLSWCNAEFAVAVAEYWNAISQVK